LPLKPLCLLAFNICWLDKAEPKSYLWGISNVAGIKISHIMSQQTYTPTHCPQTGRKFTKAERKAANKAKYALERAQAQADTKPERKLTTFRKKGGVKLNLMTSEQARAQARIAKPTKVSVPTSKAKLMRMTKAQLVDIIVGSEAQASEPAPKRKPKAKRKPAQQVRKPRRKSNDGIEQAQARNHTANKVGKVKAVRTKVVHAITEGEPQPFEPRKEVIVPERKAVKRAQMRVTLLPGETPEEGIRRMKIQQAQAEAEAYRIEAEGLLAHED
jgi:hypothetical protein